MNRVARWWTEPMPLARVAAFRVLAHLFIPIDVLLTTSWVAWHADVPTDLYQPLIVGELLNLPLPTSAFVVGVKWSLVVAA
ncbi:MAG: MFS transporter permease, partial [Geodermatophilaceae bacterium]|nr:MFS transporter permease [Geodermatophilaceae bacterium]